MKKISRPNFNDAPDWYTYFFGLTTGNGMTEEMLDFKDLPGKDVYSARSLGWFAAGHNIHHCKVIREKYL